MKRKFNKVKYNIKKLQLRPEDIEANKCTHEVFSKEDGECAECGIVVNPDVCFDEENFTKAVDIVITHLESMKMIVNTCMTKGEIKAAQKYFNMIPLLHNIDTLYDICIEELNNTELDIVDLYEPIDYDKMEDSLREYTNTTSKTFDDVYDIATEVRAELESEGTEDNE